MSQHRTIACIGFAYIAKLIAAAIVVFAVGEGVNLADMWIQSRREG